MLLGLGGRAFNRDGMTVVDSVSGFFDKFKPAPSPPTSNDEVFAAGLKAQHEAMKLRVEGPARAPVELDAAAKQRLEQFKKEYAAKRANSIGNFHSKCFGAESR
jgi:hypothetical protein